MIYDRPASDCVHLKKLVLERLVQENKRHWNSTLYKKNGSGSNPRQVLAGVARRSVRVEGGIRTQDHYQWEKTSPLKMHRCHLKCGNQGFPGSPVVRNPPANKGDTGSIPNLGGSHMTRDN